MSTAKAVVFTLDDGTNNYDLADDLRETPTLTVNRQLIDINKTTGDLVTSVFGPREFRLEGELKHTANVKTIQSAVWNNGQKYTLTFQSDTGQTTYTVTNALVDMREVRVDPRQELRISFTIVPSDGSTITTA